MISSALKIYKSGGVLLKNGAGLDVSPHHLRGVVAGLPHDRPLRRATGGGRGRQPAPQRVPKRTLPDG